jgi:hypothetical protein
MKTAFKLSDLTRSREQLKWDMINPRVIKN